jgi:hypothetical protein
MSSSSSWVGIVDCTSLCIGGGCCGDRGFFSVLACARLGPRLGFCRVHFCQLLENNMLDWLKDSLHPDVFWVMATALLTLALVAVAQKQLKDLARTSRSDFLYRLKKDFFTAQVTEFIFYLENNLLTFSPVPIPAFNTVAKQGVTADKDGFTTNTIDDVLLGPLEDVGVLWKSGRLSLDEVYETFDYYVRLCVENKAIADYLSWVRKDAGDEDIYDHLLLLYKKLKEEGPKIRARKR